jgi:hypothetical protein
MTIKVEHGTVFRVSPMGSLDQLKKDEIRKVALENGYKSGTALIKANDGKELKLDMGWRIQQ